MCCYLEKSERNDWSMVNPPVFEHLLKGRQCTGQPMCISILPFSATEALQDSQPGLPQCLDTLFSLQLSHTSTYTRRHTESLLPERPLAKHSPSIQVHLEETWVS